MTYEIYTVSAITRRIKDLLEGSLPPVWVEGEVSNFTHHSSGHMYFSLKDEGAALRCVFFRQYNARLPFLPRNGIKVLARGMITLYEPSGQYQLMVSDLRPSGVGALQLAFEQLKARLAAEGLFDQERKRPLPPCPEVIGVVTSPTGAAIRDIVSVIRRRYPPARIVLYPARVQGEGAAEEVAGGIRAFAAWKGADLLIVGRGGGSVEDLWAFNEEIVARAIFESPVPVISAVGHETDFTIADFVADLRAPTPSAAAEYAVPEARELLENVEELLDRLAGAADDLLKSGMQFLDDLERRLAPASLLKRVGLLEERCMSLDSRLKLSLLQRLEKAGLLWERLRAQLDNLNPAAVLSRGFSLVRTIEGELVRSAGQVAEQDLLEVILARGALEARVERVHPEPNEKIRIPGREPVPESPHKLKER